MADHIFYTIWKDEWYKYVTDARFFYIYLEIDLSENTRNSKNFEFMRTPFLISQNNQIKYPLFILNSNDFSYKEYWIEICIHFVRQRWNEI